MAVGWKFEPSLCSPLRLHSTCHEADSVVADVDLLWKISRNFENATIPRGAEKVRGHEIPRPVVASATYRGVPVA